MCDLHDRLIDRARALGACRVRIEHGGARGSGRRFRRHPHLTGEINGKTFKFPVKGRPRDVSRAYRRACLRDLEERLRAVGRLPAELGDVNKERPRPCPD
jgi:hypothetical protein